MLCSILSNECCALGSHGQPSFFSRLDRVCITSLATCHKVPLGSWSWNRTQQDHPGASTSQDWHLGSHQPNHRMDPNLWLQVLRLGQRQVWFKSLTVSPMPRRVLKKKQGMCMKCAMLASTWAATCFLWPVCPLGERWWNYGKPMATYHLVPRNLIPWMIPLGLCWPAVLAACWAGAQSLGEPPQLEQALQ